MVWTYTKEGLVYMFTWKGAGDGTASRRMRGEGIMREYRGCWGRTLVIMTPIETCVKTSNFKKFPLINGIVEVF